jgi:DNA replicative helicase MCM subunit Mcm2 (Cdc46/Mcm family)
MNKGGRTSTTWETGSTWRSTEFKTIRVPIALADEIKEYAKALDNGIAISHGNTAEFTLGLIERYIEYKRQNYHPNQNSKQLDISTRAWDELRKFQKLVQENPKALGIDHDRNTCRSHSAEL